MTDQEAREERRLRNLEIDLVAHRAAKEATRDVFAHLGVNVDDPAQVEEFRKDLRFGGQLRKAADKSFIAFVITGFLVLGAAAWFGVAQRFNGDGG